MKHLSDFNNNSGTSKISINCIRILPFCAKFDNMVPSSRHRKTSNHEVVPMLSSPPHSPKMFMKKISKAINPFVFFKTKKQEELPAQYSKKIMKKIDKASQYLCLKMKQKQQEDEKCLWKKTILMGEKCQPLQFPGAIFYDSQGNQLSEPRSPRANSVLFSTLTPN